MQLSDDERDELRSAARKFLDAEAGSERVRALLDDERGHDPRVWGTVADLGWPAIHVPEAHGGMGASYTDLVVILHELGRHVAPTPFLSSAVLGAEALLLATNDAVRADLLPSVIGGERIVTVAGPTGSCESGALGVTWSTGNGLRLDGTARFVPDAHVADGIVVVARDASGGVTMALVEPNAAGVRIAVEPTFDRTRRLARVDLDGVAVDDSKLLGQPGAMQAQHRRLTSLGAIAVCADALGAAEHMLEVSSAYAKQRMQFGRAIGSFQAVKHHCANMLVAVEASRAAVAYAAQVLDDPSENVDMAASVAKSFVGPACADSCQLAVQVHGGIGFTWEHDAHLYLKRAKLDEALFGTASWHRRRVAAAVLGG